MKREMQQSEQPSESDQPKQNTALNSGNSFENFKLESDKQKEQLMLLAKYIKDLKEKPDQKQKITEEFSAIADPNFIKSLDKFLKESAMLGPDGDLFGMGIAYLIQINEYIFNGLHRNFDLIYKNAKWEGKNTDQILENQKIILQTQNMSLVHQKKTDIILFVMTGMLFGIILTLFY